APAAMRGHVAVPGQHLLEGRVLRMLGLERLEALLQTPRIESGLEHLHEIPALRSEPVLVDLPGRNAAALEVRRELEEGIAEAEVGVRQRSGRKGRALERI